MSIETIDGRRLREMILAGVLVLEQSKASIDALNVFPVPDGDTGTNMTMTMLSAAKELAKVDSSNVSVVAEALARGSLRGARGNSGVILSQIWRGFARALEGEEELTAEGLAEAFAMGTETAYKAMMKPREGTILTVQRALGEEAAVAAKQSQDLLTVLDVAMQAGESTLRRTPDMLPILKQAGVVDAGGKGLLIIIAGMRAVLRGEEVDSAALVAELGTADLSAIETEEEDSRYTYCTELVIERMHDGVSMENVDSLRAKLSLIGDCVLVVGDLTLVKVHVHTDSPGRVLSEGLKLGELTNIKVDNMRQQHNSLMDGLAGDAQSLKEYAIVSVVAGDGLEEVFRDLGADGIVSGGQTMNPSIEDIDREIKRVRAKHVYVLPNNPNIILAAQQAVQLNDHGAMVIPTRTVPQGIAAMVAFMGASSPDENAARMVKAAQEVVSGAVSYAVRDTVWKEQPIAQGDILGLCENDIAVVGKDVADVTVELIGRMFTDDHSVITLFFGADVPDRDAEALRIRLAESYGEDVVEVRSGGQGLYYYLVSVE